MSNDDYTDEPWCENFDGHKAKHQFCAEHQVSWCRVCDEGICPDCVNDPHCPECGAALFDEYHDWDCSYGD